jgi:hypothetical protein
VKEAELMYIEMNEISIRAFGRKDAVSLHRIVREKEIVRFMRDGSENAKNLDFAVCL